MQGLWQSDLSSFNRKGDRRKRNTKKMFLKDKATLWYKDNRLTDANFEKIFSEKRVHDIDTSSFYELNPDENNLSIPLFVKKEDTFLVDSFKEVPIYRAEFLKYEPAEFDFNNCLSCPQSMYNRDEDSLQGSCWYYDLYLDTETLNQFNLS